MMKGALFISISNCYMHNLLEILDPCSLAIGVFSHSCLLLILSPIKRTMIFLSILYLKLLPISSFLIVYHFGALANEIFRYANEPGIMKYIKIAATLPDKTVRDVAMRCQWMAAVSP